MIIHEIVLGLIACCSLAGQMQGKKPRSLDSLNQIQLKERYLMSSWFDCWRWKSKFAGQLEPQCLDIEPDNKTSRLSGNLSIFTGMGE
jgi:hypothetical protein